jgi:sugar lactone lactonase YvrE
MSKNVINIRDFLVRIKMSIKIKTILIFSFICLTFASGSVLAKTNKMWVKLDVASDTAKFQFNLPHSGCVSIISTVPGRKQIDRLWGPRYMNEGTYSLKFPAGRILNRKGKVELFNIALAPGKTIGKRGRGERQFSRPKGLAFDKIRKELLIADTGNDRIIRLSKTGRFLSQYGGFGLAFGDKSEEKEDSLDSPYDVSAGGFSNFYVSDQNNFRTCIFDSYKSYKGNLFPTNNDRKNKLDRPRGIKVDYENYIWLVDGRADKVLKISSNGEKLLELGGFGYSTFQLKDPVQIDIDIHGKIYISDRGNGRIAIFDRLGSYIKEMRNHLKAPTGVAIDPDGLILVCDEETSEIGLYTPKGIRLAFINSTNNGSQFRMPSDIAVAEDMVYLLDSGNHRIVFINREKTSTSVPWQAASPVIE